jgi:hypothetical protein
MAEIAGFWSYVHADNDSVGDGIAKLAMRVMSEFELLSGEQLRLFVDRTDLEWGDEWKGRIDRELQETTFFIPIITPRYFQSEECRRELVKFKSAADRFGVKQLLLPIYYVAVPEMDENDPQDELISFVKSIQREDMRQARLAEESDSVYRTLVNRLAAKLLNISLDTEGLTASTAEFGSPSNSVETPPVPDRPTDDPPATDIPQHSEEKGQIPAPPEEDEEGTLERLAAGESALSMWVETVQELNDEIVQIGELTQTATPLMADAESFAARLAVANKLAVQLDEPAENLTRIAQDYSTHLITIDPAIQALIENARNDEDAKEDPGLKDLFSVILQMVHSSRGGSTGIRELIRTMEEPAAQSRELRSRLRRIQTALRNIADGQKVLDDWEFQIQNVYGDSLGPAED